MDFPKLPPFEVPPEDRDLLDVGVVLTRSSTDAIPSTEEEKRAQALAKFRIAWEFLDRTTSVVGFRHPCSLTEEEQVGLGVQLSEDLRQVLPYEMHFTVGERGFYVPSMHLVRAIKVGFSVVACFNGEKPARQTKRHPDDDAIIMQAIRGTYIASTERGDRSIKKSSHKKRQPSPPQDEAPLPHFATIERRWELAASVAQPQQPCFICSPERKPRRSRRGGSESASS